MFKLTSIIIAMSLSFNALASIEISGEVTQGGLIVGKTKTNNKVYLNDKPLKISANGDYAFGFGRDEKNSFVLSVHDQQGNIFKKTLTPSIREYKIQRINGIKKSIMKPNPKAVSRSQKDNAQVKLARSTTSELTAFSQGFIAPIDGIITGVYGSQRVFNDVPKNPHYGLDYAGDIGDPVKTPADGVVTLWVPDMFYSGGTMIIDHGHGINSTFLHLSASDVKVGDNVKQGDIVAEVGKSGRATGPHLDWRVNWYNVRLDPALALKVKTLP